MSSHHAGDLVSVEQIEPRILLVRGQRVILDADLAELYGTSTKAFNQAVKRNRERFPADFHVPAYRRGGEIFKVTDCDHIGLAPRYAVTICDRIQTQYPLRPQGLHRAWGVDGGQRTEHAQGDGGKCLRDQGLRPTAGLAGHAQGTGRQAGRVGAEGVFARHGHSILGGRHSPSDGAAAGAPEAADWFPCPAGGPEMSQGWPMVPLGDLLPIASNPRPPQSECLAGYARA